MKYILLPNGKIQKSDVGQNPEIIEANSLINGENYKGIDLSSNYEKFSFRRGLLFKNTYEENEYPLNAVINQTDQLRNDSFGFIDTDSNQPNNSNRKVEFYTSYNSVFDLNNEKFSDESSPRIPRVFSTYLDFYAVPQIFTNPVNYLDETVLRLFTLLDSIIAASIPILTVSTLQFILQLEQSGNDIFSSIFGNDNEKSKRDNEKFYELGSYITYASDQDTWNQFFESLKITLNSFERLMNFPKFKMTSDFSISFETFSNFAKEILLRLIYFVIGYSSYLIPGFKFKLINTNNTTLTQLSLDLTENLLLLLTVDSSRHPFDLLIRKILRNNFFFKKSRIAKTTQGLSSLNIIESLSYLGTFFYRFIGERVSIGEKVIRIDFMSNNTKSYERFVNYRDKDKKLIHNLNALITTNPSDEKSFSSYIEQRNKNLIELSKSKDYRISKASLDAIEDIIDQDYVPFSLHDLRNNDVIKFHAFIESISDSFSSSYNEAGGYGRQEKIKTFVNTTRSINLSFRLVATSKEDHHEMWHIINKIVMMIYPQWSKGVPARKINRDELNVDYKIPFTQLPSNTPIVRLRLGDLITSNYNKTSISNTFGFTKSHNQDQDNNKNTLDEFISDKKNDKEKDNRYIFAKQNIDILKNARYKLSEQTELEKEKIKNGTGDIKKQLAEITEKSIKQINEFTNSIKIIKEEIERTDYSKINNPITYAYESTLGRGLAGHITSLGIDWDQETPWDIDEGNRAPMFVKISIGFSPVHDIPLGLDHNGTMRAVPYMVGSKVKGLYNNESFNFNENEFTSGRR
jgi:hypothetical protein